MSNKWQEVRETLRIFIPLAIMLSLGVGVFLYIDRKIRLSNLEADEKLLVEMGRNNMVRNFDILISDVLILAQSDAMNVLINDDTDRDRAALASIFMDFVRDRKIYDQIRFIDKSGNEVVRINRKNGKATVTPEWKLQNKSEMYYFSRIMTLGRGEIFISPLDLNVEHGKTEMPPKPIIRIGTPIFDKRHGKQGILILNYLGNKFIESFSKAISTSTGDAYLLNRNGSWLRSSTTDGNRKGTFADDYPKAWKHIKNTVSGKFYTADGLFTFTTFSPGNKNYPTQAAISTGSKNSPVWKIVTYIPDERYSFASLKRFRLSLAFFAGILIFLALGSWKIRTVRLNKKLHDEALRKLERRFSAAFNSSPSMISITSINDGKILDVNEIWLSTLGYKREEVIGKTVFELDMWTDSKQRSELINKITGEGRIHNFEGELKAKDGTVRNFIFSGERIELDEGAMALLTITDITERRHAEIMLQEAKDNAELTNRTKTEFLANMSHELRTPLNAIIGFSEIMSTETFGPIGRPEYLEYATYIKESGAHLLELINDILDVSRIEADGLPLSEDIVDIERVIASCHRLVRIRAHKVGLNVTMEIPDILPAMLADERRLKQVLINLLSNAIKFTPKGGNVTIKAGIDNDGRYLFSIIDDGIGIKPADMETVLSTFGQADGSLSRSHEGAGLGLPLSKRLVELHGGELTVESTPGIGTTVNVYFPAERVITDIIANS